MNLPKFKELNLHNIKVDTFLDRAMSDTKSADLKISGFLKKSEKKFCILKKKQYLCNTKKKQI